MREQRRGKVGEIRIDPRAHGDGVIETRADEALAAPAPDDVRIANDLVASSLATPPSSSFFTPMVRCPDAMMGDVQACA